MLLAVLLTLHSWCRWAVVLSTLAAGARCASGWVRGRRWTPLDARFARAWVGAIDLQMSLGMLLYLSASPLAAIARRDLAAAWLDPWLRFFGILHPVAMLAATSVAHASWIWARRADEGARDRFRRLGLGVLATTVIVGGAIPWPFLPYGRPLARIGFE